MRACNRTAIVAVHNVVRSALAHGSAPQIHRQVQRAPAPRKCGREPHSCLVGQRPWQLRVSQPYFILLRARPVHLTAISQLSACCAKWVREFAEGAEGRPRLLRQRFLLHALSTVRRHVCKGWGRCVTLSFADTATITSAGANCSPRTSVPLSSCHSSPAAAPSPSRSIPATLYPSAASPAPRNHRAAAALGGMTATTCASSSKAATFPAPRASSLIMTKLSPSMQTLCCLWLRLSSNGGGARCCGWTIIRRTTFRCFVRSLDAHSSHRCCRCRPTPCSSTAQLAAMVSAWTPTPTQLPSSAREL